MSRFLACCLLLGTARAQVDDRQLEVAWQKEFAFLEAEQRALAERKAVVERENAAALTRAKAQLAATQQQVLALGQEADALAEALREAQTATAAAREGQAGLESLLAAFDQGLSPYASAAEKERESGGLPRLSAADAGPRSLCCATARADGFKLPEGTETAKISAAFARAGELMAERSGIRRAPGAFFLADGQRVEGTLVRLGDVALIAAAALLWFALGLRLLGLRTRPVLRRARAHAARIVARGGPDLEHRIEVALADLRATLSSGRALVRSLVVAAPLAGLLGTVSGMIETFDSLADGALFARSGGIAGGIAQALLTTQMGLVVAVPGVIVGRLLDRRQATLEARLDVLRSEAAEGRLAGVAA